MPTKYLSDADPETLDERCPDCERSWLEHYDSEDPSEGEFRECRESWAEREAARGDWLRDCAKDEGR